MFQSVLGYFISEELRGVLDDYYRARILVLVAIVASVLLIPFLVMRASWQGVTHPYSLVLAYVMIAVFTRRLLYFVKPAQFERAASS